MKVNLLRAHGTRSRYDAGCRCGLCRAGLADYNRRYYAANRSECMARVARNNAKNPAEKAERDRRYYAAHADKAKAYREANRERRAQQSSAWREKNMERLRAYRAAHIEDYRAAMRRYKARKRAATGSHTGDDIRAQYARQRGRCYYCGKRVRDKYDVDHVIPLALGGSDGPENLVVACVSCNRKKQARHPQDFAGILF